MRKTNAFTLAEVLITLGIIGVVAAMTMPALLNSTQNKQYITAYKRALATISQGAVMNYALEDTDFETGNAWEILRKRMNVANVDETSHILTFNDGIQIKLSGDIISKTEKDKDGKDVTTSIPSACSNLTQPPKLDGGNKKCLAIIDVNGEKGPTYSIGTVGEGAAAPTGRDQFLVILTKQGVSPADTKGQSVITTDKMDDKTATINNNRLDKDSSS